MNTSIGPPKAYKELFPFIEYRTLSFLYRFTRPRILPFLRELNMVTLQRAKWGLKSSDSSDLMFTRSYQSVYSSSIFLQYSVAIIAMKLSQHTYPGTLITDPTAVCGSVVPLMRVHCLCYSLLSPIWSIVDVLWLPLASCFQPKPLGPMSASTASFSGLSSDSILLFRPYLGILSPLTFSSPLFISYSLDAVAATATIHCVFSLRSVRLTGVWDINHTLPFLSTVSLISLFLRTKCYWYLWLCYIYSPWSYHCMHIPEHWLLIQPIFTNLHREFHTSMLCLLIWPAFTGLRYKRDSRSLNDGNFSVNDLDPA